MEAPILIEAISKPDNLLMEGNIGKPDYEPPQAEPIYAGFYANLVGFHKSTIIVFLVEFILLFLMAISMYIFYLREKRLKSKIKFRATGDSDAVSSPRDNQRLHYSNRNKVLLK